jgi:tRNA(fMet)-specific endonuclease VapC
MYLLDTNTLIYFFKGMGRVTENLFKVPPSEVGLSAIVLHELETGIAKSKDAAKRRAQLGTFINAAVFLPFGRAEAEAAARIRSDLERAGTPIGPLDSLIAATALANGATLIAHNQREFSRVPGLMLEDWF